MPTVRAKLYALIDFLREILTLAKLLIPEVGRGKQKPKIPVIASMTTYPPRIKWAWVAIETVLRQSVRPEKLLLVLNTEEFPNQRLPLMIRSQTRRGLEILWVEKNGRSYDKLLPARREHPHANIVTFDDDKFFPFTLLESLYESSLRNPSVVIGARGWIIGASSGALHYGRNWIRAEAGDQGNCIFVPGGNGCLYPPNSMDKRVLDMEGAMRVCPTADDIWFWAAARSVGATFMCIGLPAHRPVMALKRSPALSEVNETENERQFQRAIDYWGIRKSLIPCHVESARARD